jgi:hypothetical protein
MSAHTPGPWQANGSHIYTADSERALLAQVFNPGSKASDYPLVENARLIAAAPELLEALKAIELALKLPTVTPAQVLHESGVIRQGIRAAIARAEGK